MADEDDLALDLSGKKKKVKKTKAALDEPTADERPTEAQDMATDELILGKKKKGKDKIKKDEEQIVEEEKSAVTTIAEGIGRVNLVDAKEDWPDYAYDELLNMVFDIMREKNPDYMSGAKKTLTMKPPNVARAGSKKTAFTNFTEICRILKRQPKHVLQFILAELGTTGSIDGNQCLIVKGRFQQKHFESVLRKYIKEYVTCHTCRSSDTELTKDTRLNFLKCNVCGSKCSVSAIKTGFTAMVGKRAAQRRANEITGVAK